MAEGATRTRRVLLVGSSLAYYNGGIDAIVGGGGGGGGGLCSPAARGWRAQRKRKQSRMLCLTLRG
jgi:hypothetical protein